MARSYRYRPFCGLSTARTEKGDKRRANRAYRAAERASLAAGREPPNRREVSDVWLMDKDGKQRFDPVRWPSVWRK